MRTAELIEAKTTSHTVYPLTPATYHYRTILIDEPLATSYEVDLGIDLEDWQSARTADLDMVRLLQAPPALGRSWQRLLSVWPTEAAFVPTAPRAAEVPELAERFKELAEQWRRETDMLSSVQRKVMHKAYQRIIGMGPIAVPLILMELRERPGFWFWALTAITGEDPAADTERFEDARQAWLSWGEARGYL